MCRSATPCKSASRRDHTIFFWRRSATCLRGTGGPIAAKRKIANSQNSKFQKLQIARTKIAKTLIVKFRRDRSRNCFQPDRILVLTIGGKTFASSLLALRWQCARCILKASKQCPYEATTSTRLNSHGSEERTQEDTMNPMWRKARPRPRVDI
jgi:hypothetical protein